MKTSEVAEMIVRGVRRWTALALLPVVAGGCAAGAWRWEGTDDTFNSGDLPSEPPTHRTVEHVTLRIRDHEFEFVGYRTCDPATREVRVQWLLESGISVLDVAVHGAENRRNSGSVFEAIPHFAEISMEDLRRTWGSRSAFCTRWREPPEFGNWPMVGGNILRTRPLVTDGERTLPVESVDDGSWVAIVPRSARRGDPLHVTLLDRDLVPEATIDYSDFDENGVPREIHLVDPRDGHALDIEVEEVRLLPAKDAATPVP